MKSRFKLICWVWAFMFPKRADCLIIGKKLKLQEQKLQTSRPSSNTESSERPPWSDRDPVTECYAFWESRGFYGNKLDKIMATVEQLPIHMQSQNSLQEWYFDVGRHLQCKNVLQMDRVIHKDPEILNMSQEEIFKKLNDLKEVFAQKDAIMMARKAPSILRMKNICTEVPKQLKTLKKVLPTYFDPLEAVRAAPLLLTLPAGEVLTRAAGARRAAPLPAPHTAAAAAAWRALAPQLAADPRFEEHLAARVGALRRRLPGADLAPVVRSLPMILTWDSAKIKEQMNELRSMLPEGSNIVKIVKTNPKVLSYSVLTLKAKVSFLRQHFDPEDVKSLVEKNPSILSSSLESMIPLKIKAIQSLFPDDENVQASKMLAKEPRLMTHKLNGPEAKERVQQLRKILGWINMSHLASSVAVKFPQILTYNKQTIENKIATLLNFMDHQTIATVVLYTPKVLQLSPVPNIKSKVETLAALFPEASTNEIIRSAPSLLNQNMDTVKENYRSLQNLFSGPKARQMMIKEPSLLCRNFLHVKAKMEFIDQICASLSDNARVCRVSMNWEQSPEVLVTASFASLNRLYYCSLLWDDCSKDNACYSSREVIDVLLSAGMGIDIFLSKYPGYSNFLQAQFSRVSASSVESSVDRMIEIEKQSGPFSVISINDNDRFLEDIISTEIKTILLDDSCSDDQNQKKRKNGISSTISVFSDGVLGLQREHVVPSPPACSKIFPLDIF